MKKYLLIFLFYFTSVKGDSFSSLNEMSIEEKVGQLLIVHFNGDRANSEAQVLIEKAHVGGFIYYNWANDLSSPSQVKLLSDELQQLNRHFTSIPLLIAVDQEGGSVNRLKAGFTEFPSAYALAQTHNCQLVEQVALAMGQELKAVGINLNLAPVVDVNTNPSNPVIGIRSFGNDPQTVIQFARAALKGYQAASILTALKHFPGHGDTSIDSHHDLPSINKTKDQLNTIELLPFKALASQSDIILTAHLLIPALDAQQCVTFSRPIIEGLLRKEIGFSGVIMTDSLVMQGILNRCQTVEEAALKSFEAGHDLLLLGGKQLNKGDKGLELTVPDILSVHQTLVKAVREGKITEKRLDESLERILKLKSKYDQTPSLNLLNNHASIAKHQQLAKEAAQQALKIEQPCKTQLGEHLILVAPTSLENAIKAIKWPANKTMHYFYLHEECDNKEQSDELIAKSKEADTIIFCTYNAWKFPYQLKTLQQLQKLKKPLIVLITGYTQDSNLINQSHLIVYTFSPTSLSIQSAIERLNHE